MKIYLYAMLFLVSTHTSFAVSNNAKAPNFKLSGHDGKTYSLSQFKGKHVVLEWYNDDCPYVDKHYESSNMQNLQKEFTKKGVVWLSIISSAPGKQGHVDQEGATKLVKQRQSAPTAVLLDPKGVVGRQYNAQTTPHMYVIAPSGKLVYQGAIDDKPSANPKSLKTASPWFKNALLASMNGKKIENGSTSPYGCSVKY